jgi:hypothetical protein
MEKQMKGKTTLGRYSRIPAPIDTGRHYESSVEFLWDYYLKYKTALESGEEYTRTDTAENYACGLPVPPFQRDPVWTIAQQIKFIESVWQSITLGSYTLHEVDWDTKTGKPLTFSFWIIDGLQRLTTLQNFFEDKFRVFGLYYSELTEIEIIRFLRTKFVHYESDLWDLKKIENLYDRLAFGGTPHKESDRILEKL